MPNKSEKIPVTLVLPKDLWKLLHLVAVKEETTRSAIIAELVAERVSKAA